MAFQGNHLGTLLGRGFALIKNPGRDPLSTRYGNSPATLRG